MDGANRNPVMAESKLQADSVIPSSSEIEAMIAAEIACTTKQMTSKEISTLSAESFHDILQCAYKNACNGIQSVIYTS